ncbi:hypothetical protein LWI29_023496 [Acer saccharum]|uniref:B box-type domain-containing protein n=1 Tax=Acer saccharum TaxID=4024 RepID=A0AA39RXG0_ACESA|nr:hypothetical protein LWI29_023496 [Acer saccharum]
MSCKEGYAALASSKTFPLLVSSHLPRWLEVLLTEKFFNACVIHEDEKKNEKNIYCLDCCISICPHCLSIHNSHRLLQIRRYVYHDVIRLDDAANLVDCSYIQIDSLIRTEGGLSKFFFECKFLTLPEAGFDDGLITPDSVLEPIGSTRTSSGSGGYGDVECTTLACTATTKIARKKRSSLTAACRSISSSVPGISANLMSRRKKTPQRAPLH